MQEFIPRKLHFVWVGGGKKPPLVEQCIESFHKFCPDYEITEWNENNFDISQYPIISAALKARNWALASDVMRMHIMYHEGGIYLDTDCEIIKPLDGLLARRAFLAFESDIWLGPHILGGEKNHPFFKKCLSRYKLNKSDEILFSTNIMTVHAVSTFIEDMYGVVQGGKTQILNEGMDDEIVLYSRDYFSPKDYMTGKLNLTDNSHVIHRYTSTWHSKSKRFWAGVSKWTRIILGRHIFKLFEKRVHKHYKKQIRKEFKKLEGSGK